MTKLLCMNAILLSSLLMVDSQRPIKTKVNPQQEAAIITGSVFFGLIVLFLIGLIIYRCVKTIFPDGNNLYSALELDDIRIERASDFETMLMDNINILKEKLTFSRKKKTEVLIRREITEKLGERVEAFDSKGYSVYGKSWASGDVPIRDLVSIPEKELRSLQIEAQNIVTQRKAEEERDLFKLWKEELENDSRSMKIPSGGGSSRAVATSSAEDAALSSSRVDVLSARANRVPASALTVGDPRFATKNSAVVSSSSSSVKKRPDLALDLNKVSFPPRNVQVPKGKSPMKASTSSTDFSADDKYDIQVPVNVGGKTIPKIPLLPLSTTSKSSPIPPSSNSISNGAQSSVQPYTPAPRSMKSPITKSLGSLDKPDYGNQPIHMSGTITRAPSPFGPPRPLPPSSSILLPRPNAGPMAPPRGVIPPPQSSRPRPPPGPPPIRMKSS